MKISILLPYKENYSKNYAGAVSIFVSQINKISKFKSTTKIYGNTDFKNYLSKNYTNILFKKKYFQSSSKIYLNNFINLEKKRRSDIIEIHNRPSYLKYPDIPVPASSNTFLAILPSAPIVLVFCIILLPNPVILSFINLPRDLLKPPKALPKTNWFERYILKKLQ